MAPNCASPQLDLADILDDVSHYYITTCEIASSCLLFVMFSYILTTHTITRSRRELISLSFVILTLLV